MQSSLKTEDVRFILNIKQDQESSDPGLPTPTVFTLNRFGLDMSGRESVFDETIRNDHIHFYVLCIRHLAYQADWVAVPGQSREFTKKFFGPSIGIRNGGWLNTEYMKTKRSQDGSCFQIEIHARWSPRHRMSFRISSGEGGCS